MKKFSFIFLNANIGIFAKGHTYIAIYINNLLITTFSIKKINEIKFALYNKFNIIDFGPCLYYLGIIVKKNRPNKAIYFG